MILRLRLICARITLGRIGLFNNYFYLNADVKVPMVGTKVGNGNIKVVSVQVANSRRLDNKKVPVCGDNTAEAKNSLASPLYGQYGRTFFFSPEDKLARTKFLTDIARALRTDLGNSYALHFTGIFRSVTVLHV